MPLPRLFHGVARCSLLQFPFFVGRLNAQFWAMESFLSFTSNRKSTLVIPDNTEVCDPDYTKLLFPLHHKDSHSWLINTSPSFTGQKLKWLFTGSTYTIGTLHSNKESPMFQLTVGCEYKVIHKLQLQQLSPGSYLANTGVKYVTPEKPNHPNVSMARGLGFWPGGCFVFCL